MEGRALSGLFAMCSCFEDFAELVMALFEEDVCVAVEVQYHRLKELWRCSRWDNQRVAIFFATTTRQSTSWADMNRRQTTIGWTSFTENSLQLCFCKNAQLRRKKNMWRVFLAKQRPVNYIVVAYDLGHAFKGPSSIRRQFKHDTTWIFIADGWRNREKQCAEEDTSKATTSLDPSEAKTVCMPTRRMR